MNRLIYADKIIQNLMRVHANLKKKEKTKKARKTLRMDAWLVLFAP